MDNKIFLLLSVGLVCIAACRKSVEDGYLKKPEAPVAQHSSARLSYGGNLFFLKNNNTANTILPVSKPALSGVFKAIPRGLSIDSVTGRINIRRSLTGMRYKVYYVSPAGYLLDSTALVISGVDYADSIYVLNSTPNLYDVANPIYNAGKTLPLPCSDDDDDLCVFDETDLNNDGNDDIAGVNQSKLLVDEKTGVIDVEGSFHAGVFGSTTPANGTTRNFTMYYRLNDASNRALNSIPIRVIYYRRLADVPRSLLNTLQTRKMIDQRVLLSPPPGNTSLTIDEYATVKLDFATYSKPRRPPTIVIIGQ